MKEWWDFLVTPIRVPHVFGTLNAKGAETRIMELYRTIDKEEIQFDFYKIH